MQYFLLGLAALAFALVIAQAFVKANPATLAQRLRSVAGVAALAAAGIALVRGAAAYAFPLAILEAGCSGARALRLGHGPARVAVPAGKPRA